MIYVFQQWLFNKMNLNLKKKCFNYCGVNGIGEEIFTS